MKKNLCLGALPILAVAIVGLTSYSAAAETKWNLAAPLSDGNMHTTYVHELAKAVADRTGGEFKINVHANQSLLKETETLKAVRNGQIPLGQFFIYRMGNDNPIYNTSQLPFIAGKTDLAWKMWQLSKEKTAELLAEQGVKILMAVPWPENAFYSKEPLKSVDQFKGAKFRTFSPITSRMAELMGADPIQIQVSEVAQAFATNLVQLMFTSAQTGIDNQAWDFAKYYTHARGGVRSMTLTVVNEKALGKLSPEFRGALLDAANDTQTYGWLLSEVQTQRGIATLQEHGMVISQPTPELETMMQDVGGTILQEWAKDAGEPGEKILNAFKAQ